ncbi:hypothetical protein BgiBS90_034167, partial [Biomphalaria glabrata]
TVTDETDSNYKKVGTCRVVVLVSLVFLLIAVIVAAIILAVLLTKTKEDAIPTNVQELQMNMRIMNKIFLQDYENRSSAAFLQLEEETCAQMKNVFPDPSIECSITNVL